MSARSVLRQRAALVHASVVATGANQVAAVLLAAG